MIIFVKNKHRLQVDEFTFKCCIGQGGVTKDKKEGDKKLQKVAFKLKIFILEKIVLKNH